MPHDPMQNKPLPWSDHARHGNIYDARNQWVMGGDADMRAYVVTAVNRYGRAADLLNRIRQAWRDDPKFVSPMIEEIDALLEPKEPAPSLIQYVKDHGHLPR